MTFDADNILEDYLDDYGDTTETNGIDDLKDIKDFGSLDKADLLIIEFLIGFIIFFLALAVVRIIAMWKVFKKAGRGGWEAIVPFYNAWVLYEISGLKGWIIFFAFIPYIGTLATLVFTIIAYINLSRAFNKNDAYSIGLLFLPTIFFSILGFGKDEYTNTDKAIKVFN